MFARMDALNRHLRSESGAACRALQPLLTNDEEPADTEVGVGAGDALAVISHLSEALEVTQTS